MKRQMAYIFIAFSLIFTLAAGFIPGSSASGSNLPPGVTLQSPVGLSNLPTNSLIRYSHTYQVGSNGTPTQNGTSLLQAMGMIASANPSATNPYLLKLEPGSYDLGNQALIIGAYVDLEGSGELNTVISSTIGSGLSQNVATLTAASNSEVRSLKVSNSGSSTYQLAVYVPPTVTNVRFTRAGVAVSGSGSNLFSYGIYNSGSTILQESTVSASGGTVSYFLFNIGTSPAATITVANSTLGASGGTSSYGLYINDGTSSVTNSTLSAANAGTSIALDNHAVSIVQNSQFSAVGGTTDYAFYNGSGSGTVTGSSLTVGGGTSYGFYTNSGSGTVQGSSLTVSSTSAGYGFYSSGGTTLMQNSTASLSGGVDYGFYNNGGFTTVQNSTISMTGVQSYAFYNNSGTSRVENSILSSGFSPGNSVAFYNNGATAQVASSFLDGNMASSGLSNCLFSYKSVSGNFQALNGSCQ